MWSNFRGRHLATIWYNLLTKIERFRDLFTKDIWAMLNAVTPSNRPMPTSQSIPEGPRPAQVAGTLIEAGGPAQAQ